MNIRAEIIKDILNEYYDEFDFQSFEGDVEIDVNVHFYIEKALNIIAEEINVPILAKNIIKHIFEKNEDWCKLAESDEGLVLMFETFDKVVNLRDAEIYGYCTEKIDSYIKDIINFESFEKENEREVLKSLSEEIDVGGMTDCIEIEFDGDLEDIAREDYAERESTKQSDDDDFWSWRRS